jgi:hypothetical protein
MIDEVSYHITFYRDVQHGWVEEHGSHTPCFRDTLFYCIKSLKSFQVKIMKMKRGALWFMKAEMRRVVKAHRILSLSIRRSRFVSLTLQTLYLHRNGHCYLTNRKLVKKENPWPSWESNPYRPVRLPVTSPTSLSRRSIQERVSHTVLIKRYKFLELHSWGN